MYRISELAKLTGVSVRALHYYDQIGLLKPSSLGANGYRYYENTALLRLQQILFYRELEMKLEEIKTILDCPDFDVLTALSSHKKALQGRAERLKRLLQTVDRTIAHLKGKESMNVEGLFEGFSEEEQDKYAQEAEQMFDPATVKASNRKWKTYLPEEKQRILAEGKAIYVDLASGMTKGAGSSEVQLIITRWHKHMQYFWNPTDEQLTGLADLYNADARFRTNFDQLNPKLAEFLRKAVKLYVQSRKKE